MAEGKEPQVVIGRCDCHEKHVAIFGEHEKRMDNMQKWFIITVILVCGALGWLVVQGNSMAKSVTRIEAVLPFMVKADEEMKISMDNVHKKLDEHINQWNKKNGTAGP